MFSLELVDLEWKPPGFSIVLRDHGSACHLAAGKSSDRTELSLAAFYAINTRMSTDGKRTK